MSDYGVASSPNDNAHQPSEAELPADLPIIVGRNLRRLRMRRGLSLERLAKQSGVSRAMLGQIETGKSVPTIALLWKVAAALNVPFANLLQTEASRAPIVLRGSDAKLLTSSQGQFVSRALFPFDGERSVEFYELRIAPLHREMAEAHPAGTQENLIVAKGVVEITVGGHKPLTLAEGDAVLFDADSPHCYRNLVTNEAVLYLVMSYGERVS